METAQDYNMGAAFALLLIGPPKSGKTIFATCFPEPYILDCDNNLAGAIRYHQSVKSPLTTFYRDDANYEKKDGVLVPRELSKRWSFSVQALAAAIKDPRPKTIIADGLTLLAQYLESHILANSKEGNGMKDLVIAGEKVMNMSHWNPFKTMMFKLIMAARSAGKPFIMTCHEATEQAESGAVIGYRPSISGQLRHTLAGLFSDCWRCDTSVVPIDPKHPLGTKHTVRFAPMNMHQIGNSLSIKEKDIDVTNLTRDQIWSKLAPLLGITA